MDSIEVETNESGILNDNNIKRSNYSAIINTENDELEKKLLINTNEISKISKDMSTSSSCWQAFIQRNQGIITTIILCSLSVVNVTDRYIVGSVLIDIESFFQVTKSTAGLLQTSFLLTYMAFSLPNGFLGDRINRKYLLILSILVWITSTLSGSFTNKNQFYFFLLSRCLFGVATASFETISMPILGDRFANNLVYRNRAIIIFNLGPPLGFGLSYLIGIVSKDIFGNDWRYTLRFTQAILVFVLFLILIAYIEPERGPRPIQKENEEKKNTFIDDVKILIYNKTFVLLTICWTLGLASLGGFSWWSSSIIEYSLEYSGKLSTEKIDTFKKIYSFLQVIGGTLGMLLPIKISNYYHNKSIDRIDCFLLSFGFFANSLFMYFYLLMIRMDIYLVMVLYTLVIISFNTCWVIQSVIFLDIVQPSLRSTANAIVIFVLHLIGDSVSPYWTGLIADSCLNHDPLGKAAISSLLNCTQLSFYPLVFVSFASGASGLFMTLTFFKDKIHVQQNFK